MALYSAARDGRPFGVSSDVGARGWGTADDDDDTAITQEQQHAGWRNTYLEHRTPIGARFNRLETAIKGCTLWDPWKLHQVADFDLCTYLLSIRDAPTVRQVPIVLRTLSDVFFQKSLCDFIAIVLLTEPLVGAFVLHRDSINQYKAYEQRLRVFIGK